MHALRGAEDLAEFIVRNYTGRVVEVGAGHRADVALQLALCPSLSVVVTDVEERRLGSLRVAKDDIFSPLWISTGVPACSTPSALLLSCSWPWAGLQPA